MLTKEQIQIAKERLTDWCAGVDDTDMLLNSEETILDALDLAEKMQWQPVQPDVLTIVNLIAALPEHKRRAVIEIFKES